MDKWNLTYLCKDDETWEQEFSKFDAKIADMASYQGKLGNEKDFVEYYRKQIAMDKEMARIIEYAFLKTDLNKKDLANAQRVQKCYIFFNKYSEAVSFESPEVLALGKEKVMGFVDNNKEIEELRFSFEKLFHNNEHVLSPNEEKLMSYFGATRNAASDLYQGLAVADHKNREITLTTGEKVTVTQGNWTSLIEEVPTAEDRKKVFHAIYDFYEENKVTFGNIYALSMKNEWANARSRNFNSVVESHLFANNIPVCVYENLVDVASSNSAPLKKYMKLRAKYLNLENNYYTYDRFLQLATSTKKYTYEEAKALFFESIKGCPEDFQAKAHEVLKDGFVDVYEQEGKQTGAYSSSQADLHPFILLNFAGRLDDCFTVAHESGHSIHSLYAEESQPSSLQNYTIFVAEIASTFNEHMLLDYMMKSSDLNKNDKIMLLQKQIDEIVSTFYRQTLFGHFELEVSKKVENGEPVNYEVFNKIMIDLYEKYYGLDITKEEVKPYVWAYIPHLYKTPFYVYQYATSFAASFALYANVKKYGKEAFDRYTGLLKSGGSEYPIDQTRKAGIDLTSKETFMAVTDRMSELVDELEKVLAEKD